MKSRVLFLLVAGLIGVLSRADAQKKIPEKDSINAQMAAVDALRQFQYQYHHLILLPRRADEGGQIAPVYGTCETRVVDFCYGPLNGKIKFGAIGTHRAAGLLTADSMKKVWRARSNAYVTRYLVELQRAQKRVPGDRWVNGEIVRIHLDHGFPGRAKESLAKCTDVSWWCDALRAYVVSAEGSLAESDSAWSSVLGRMSADERCEWLDPSVIIANREMRDSVSKVECADRSRLHDRLWWLADPFLSRDGNERRTAHLSRHVALILDRMTQDRVYATLAMVREGMVDQMVKLAVVKPDAALLMSCGDFGSGEHEKFIPPLLYGYPELVLRTGVPSYCGLIDEPGPIPQGTVDRRTPNSAGRAMTSLANQAPPRVQFTQYPLTRQSFLPRLDALMSPTTALPNDWDLRDPAAYEFMTGWDRPILDWWHQAGWFKHGDTTRLVVIAEEAPQDLPKDLQRPVINQLSGKLALQSDYDQPRTIFSATGTTRLTFNAALAGGPVLASLEAENPRGPFGRVRFGTAPQQMPAQRVTLSDVLLVEDLGGLPDNLTKAALHALPTTVLKEGAKTGLYWEVYGLNRGETPKFSVLVVPQPGRYPVRDSRNAQRAAGVDIVTTEWDEPPVIGNAIEPRSINLSLSTLSRGRYTLSVAVTLPGQQTVESVRTIEIVR